MKDLLLEIKSLEELQEISGGATAGQYACGGGSSTTPKPEEKKEPSHSDNVAKTLSNAGVNSGVIGTYIGVTTVVSCGDGPKKKK